MEIKQGRFVVQVGSEHVGGTEYDFPARITVDRGITRHIAISFQEGYAAALAQAVKLAESALIERGYCPLPSGPVWDAAGFCKVTGFRFDATNGWENLEVTIDHRNPFR